MNDAPVAPSAAAPSAAATYRRLLGYARPHVRVFLVATLAMALFAWTDVTFIYLMKPLLDGSFVEKDPDTIRVVPFAILGLFILRGLTGFGAAYWMSWVGRRVIHDLRGDLFDHLLKLPLAFYERMTSGALLTRLTYHVEQVAESTTSVVTTIVKEGLTVVGLLVLMFVLDWRLTLFTLFLGPIIAGLVRYVSRRFRRISGRIQESMGGLTQAAEEAIQNQREVKVFGGAPFERGQFERANEHNRKLVLKLTATQAGSTSVIQFIAAWAVAGVVYFATLPEMLEKVTPGTFVAYMGAMLALLQPLKALTTVNEKLQRGIAAASEIFRLMAEPVEPPGGSHAVPRVRGEIEFRDVGFRYGDDGPDVLDGISLKVPAGSTVAFVGRTGSGKSTLLSLLPRFRDPVRGAVLLDGVDLRDYRLDCLRSQIALVDQQVRLFNTTVAQNIAYGAQAPAPERILQAARDAYAWEFVEKLPRQLDTQLGQDGKQLSGGQRQRLTIARALFRDAPILILDEATASLDNESERYIQQALARLVEGRTTLVIAHRLTTIQNADLIVVMHDGRIVESGRHDELLARDGHYATLHRVALREDETAPA